MDKNDTISILYVEDQDDVRLFLSKILSRHYANVYLAENGKQGLELFQQYNPDIVISDIKMPVMDGLSMSARIKEINPKAKIILTTAHSDMEYFIQSIEIGINQYILKPIDRDKLYHAIDNCKEQVIMERDFIKKSIRLEQNNEILTNQQRELRDNLQKTIALKEIVTRSEENFRKVAENIQDTFWLKDGSKIIYVNGAFENLFEANNQLLYDNPDILQEFIHKDDLSLYIDAIGKHEKKTSGSISTEFRIVTPSGKIKNIWYRDVIITGVKSEERRLSTLTDISWKIENEKLHQDLRVAEQSSHIKQRILANVSHELRTPLNGIIAMTEILGTTKLDQEQSEYLETIRKSGENLMEITNNLINISEMERGGNKIETSLIITNDFFIPALSEYQKKAKEKKLGFTIFFSENFPDSFLADPGLIQQVIEHLTSNAIKFTSKGNIVISIGIEDLDEKNFHFSFAVTDSGIGIKEESLKKIFQLFAQMDDGDSRNYEGLGLGLTICSKIANMMGGSIDVKSEPGIGSTFRFSILVGKAEPTHLQNHHERKLPDLNLDVLYVEDKEVNQRIISIMLQNAGCRVDIASNGLEALKIYEAKSSYDIILMDIQMPVMDGITATKELKRKYRKLPPIIGVSANALRADAQYYIDQGLDDYISKPVKSELLYKKIARNIEKRKNNIPAPDKQTTTLDIGDNDINEFAYDELPDLDIPTLDALIDQTNNEAELIKELYMTFINETDQMMARLKESLQSENKQTIQETTHAIKGLSATIGAMKVYHTASAMDKLHKRGIFDHSNEMFLILTHDITAARQKIQDLVLDD